MVFIILYQKRKKKFLNGLGFDGLVIIFPKKAQFISPLKEGVFLSNYDKKLFLQLDFSSYSFIYY